MRLFVLASLAVLIAACGPSAPPAAEAPVASAAPATADLSSPGTTAPRPVDAKVPPPHMGDTGPAPTPLEPAPWSAPALAVDAVPAVYLAQWRKADNRATCAPIAPIDTADRPDAQPRAAHFSGGWAVAYDEPGQRSAFGVAGAGIAASGAGDSIWPDSLTWADGSIASYGLEGGSGPGHLAYLEIAGQGCLYNVWSRLGQAHLLSLLGRLRRIESPR